MDKLFSAVLEMSFGASLVILAVCLIRLALGKAPRGYAYGLWLVVLLRLLCPAFPEASFSPMPREPVPSQIESIILPQNEVLPDVLEDTVPNAPPTVVPQVPEASSGTVSTEKEMIPVKSVLAFGWAAGVAVMALYSLVSYILLRRKLRVSVLVRDNIYLADYIDTPFVIGVIRPRIYLPSSIEEDKAAHILLHEQCHIRFLDPAVKLVYFGALCMHWFNPLVWLAFFLMSQDMEMRCDEAVMKKLDADARMDYASSLLAFASPRRFAASPLAFGEGNPKRRIKNVLNYRKPAFWVTVLAVIALVIAVFCFLTDPVNPAEVNDQQLAYPGMEWNMSPEEVLEALDGAYEEIKWEESQPPKTEGGYYYHEFSLLGCESFGYPAEKIRFSFVDITGTGLNLGLYRVDVYYPDGETGIETDISRVVAAVEAVYGEAEDEYTENVYDDGTGTVVGWKEKSLNGESFWSSELKADTYYSEEDYTLLYKGYSKEHPDIFLTEAEFSRLMEDRSMVRLYCYPEYPGSIDREKGETARLLRFDAFSYIRAEQYLMIQKNNRENTFMAGKLLFQNAALSFQPENGNSHGLIVVDDQHLRVAPDIVFSIMESEIWDWDQMRRFLTEGDYPLLSERDAQKLSRKCPAERIEVRRFYSIPGDSEPDYTLVFFDGKLTWFASKDFLRVYEVEPVDMNPARIKGGLEYPGLNWGMSPQAVKKTLGITNPNSYEEWFGPGDVSGLADQNYIVLKNYECFGMKASQVEFRFSDHDDDVEGFGLDWVKIEYDESVDIQSIRAALRDVYGPESEANTWYADANAAQAIGEDILCLLYYEAEAPMDQYRFRGENLEAFRDLVAETYLVGVSCKETESGCVVNLYAGNLVHLQQWMEAVVS